MKTSSLFNPGARPWLLPAAGFGAGSLLSLLLLLDASIAVPGIIAGGAAGGVSLAQVTNRRETAVRAMFGFGAAFLIGGIISGLGIILRTIGAPELHFYSWYLSGFVISGSLSALFTRSQFISVKNAVISFLIGSVIGGATIQALVGFTGMEGSVASITGIFITNLIGGGLCGATSEPFDAVAQEEFRLMNSG
jgi:hypothetical protein